MKRPLVSLTAATLLLVLFRLFVPLTAKADEGAEKPKPKDAPKKFELRWKDCTLHWDRKVLKPARTSSPWQREHVVGKTRLVFQDRAVVAESAADGKQLWTAASPDRLLLLFLTATTDIGYFSGRTYKSDGDGFDYPREAKVLRLDLRTGKWLAALPVPSPRLAAGADHMIDAVLPGKKHVIVLSVVAKDDVMASYRVTSFSPGQVKPLWSKSFPAAKQGEKDAAVLLWAPRMPDSASSSVQQLAWVGDQVVVCAEGHQDILCLSAASGKEEWREERVWEYQRSFIGPSVWEHFFSRNKERSKKYRFAISAGPVVVAARKRIFVAVNKAPAYQFGSYLASCIVYELNERGSPVSMVNLPRLVNGSKYSVARDGLVWACQKNAFVRLAASDHDSGALGGGAGPGGPDLVGDVEWYIQLRPQARDAWLVSDSAGEPVAFGERFACSVRGGGFVMDRQDGVYQFPMALVNLRTGRARSLTLKVPYRGEFPQPKTNYSMTTRNGKSAWHTKGPFLLAITQLRMEEQRLRITFGMEGSARVVDFDVAQLMKGTEEE